MRKTIDINFIKDQNYLMISEFNIAVSDDEIDLLKHKIELTRWPDEINNKWSHGTDLNFLKSFCLSFFYLSFFHRYFPSSVFYQSLEKMGV